MTDFNEHTITQAVLDRLADTPDPRLKQLLTSLVRHLHDFVRDVEPSFAEWQGAIEFLVMPFYAGGSMADAAGHGRRLTPERAAAAAAQAARGLDYAHRRGVVHRDVKPDNVLFDQEGYAVVTDFGIASARFHARMTATGRAMGTPHYMSPEQAMGRVLDGRSDVYALGVVLYEALAGAPPFDAPDPYQVGYKHVHEAPVPVEAVAPGVPPGLAAIVARTLAKSADERYQRAGDLADALVAWLVERDAPELRLAWRGRRVV